MQWRSYACTGGCEPASGSRSATNSSSLTECKFVAVTADIIGSWHCPRGVRSSVYVTLQCPSVRPHVCLFRCIQQRSSFDTLQTLPCLHAMDAAHTALPARAFQFGQKSFDSIRFSLTNRFFSIRFGNLINLPLVHLYSKS